MGSKCRRYSTFVAHQKPLFRPLLNVLSNSCNANAAKKIDKYFRFSTLYTPVNRLAMRSNTNSPKNKQVPVPLFLGTALQINKRSEAGVGRPLAIT